MPLDPKKLTKLTRLANIADHGEVAIFQEINSLYDAVYMFKERMDTFSRAINDSLVHVVKMVENVKTIEGPPGRTPIKGVDYKDGENYVLTPKDLEVIARKVNVPVVEKVIEKVEVIREQPTVIKEITNQIKEVAVGDNPKEIADKLNTLNDIIRPEVIKGWKDLLERINRLHANVPNNFDVRAGVSHQALQALINRVIVLENAPTPSGTGFTKETPGGEVNGSNQTFTVTVQPNYVVSDGSTYFDGEGYTYSALSITMDIPPSNYIRSYY